MLNNKHIGSSLDQFLKSDNIQIPVIIGYIGNAGSGKTFESEKLMTQGFVKVDFADKLREMAWGILGWKPKNNEEYENFKLGRLDIKGFGKVNGRNFLQNIGESMNQIDKTFWCRQAKKTIDKNIIKGYTNIVVSDIRYETEIEILKSYMNKAIVKIYFCDYNSERRVENDSHVSESLAKKYKNLGYTHLQEIEV